MRLSKRARGITPFYVMELLEKARAMEEKGEDIVHMEVGEPGFPTPARIKEEAGRAVLNDRTFYTHSLGIPELRSKIAEYYAIRDGLDISPERIIVTNGTSGALLLLFGALMDHGNLLAISDPGYPCYKNIASFVDADVAQVPVSHDSRYELTVGHLELLDVKPHLVVIANPTNPTGSIYREETISALYDYVTREDGAVIIDEIYSGLVYDQQPKTALSLADEIIVIDGFSKAFAMTGFRLGWMVVPENLVRPLQCCAQNLFISPPSISQYAALSAFDDPAVLEEMRLMYKERRDFMVPRLRDLGFSIPIDPEGAFYIYGGIEKWGLDSMEFIGRALEEAKVAITPGYDFGAYGAGSHVRFSYADNLGRLVTGCNRLESWLNRL